eukprot:15449713-Alexandrium_andersonii.AAC.1
MARCSNFDVAFRDKNGRFDVDRVRQEYLGFTQWLYDRISREFPALADDNRPFAELLEGD